MFLYSGILPTYGLGRELPYLRLELCRQYRYLVPYGIPVRPYEQVGYQYVPTVLYRNVWDGSTLIAQTPSLQLPSPFSCISWRLLMIPHHPSSVRSILIHSHAITNNQNTASLIPLQLTSFTFVQPMSTWSVLELLDPQEYQSYCHNLDSKSDSNGPLWMLDQFH